MMMTDGNVHIYLDVDWTNSIIDQRSTTIYCIEVWENSVMWKSKKQSVIVRSSVATNFRAMAYKFV